MNRSYFSFLNRIIVCGPTALAFIIIPLSVSAQDANSTSSDYVSRAEYDKLKAEHEAMKQELEALKATVRQMATAPSPAAAPAQPAFPAEGPSENKQVVTTTSTVDELRQEVDTLKLQIKETFPGTTKFLLAGYGTAAFTARSGEDPFFDAAFNALFLWKLTDRLFFEGEMELEFENEETTINLEVAQASYLLNDYMTIGVGRFLNPTNFFVERQHMNWVNKLPDKPLAVYDGLFPESEMGAQLRGVIPLGPTKLEYVGFVANAPGLMTAPDDLSSLGMLDFDPTANPGGHIAVGGHVGFIPIPQLEVATEFNVQKLGRA